MDLRHLHYFIAVAEELHFGRAAQRLHMTQPPLSQQIRDLEEELQVTLFTRTSRRVELTEAGKAFLAKARRILDDVAQAAVIAQQTERGTRGRLTIGFVGTAAYHLLPQLLKRYRADFPAVELTLRELTTAEQVKALHDCRIDVGLLRPPLPQNELVTETIVEEPLVAVLPAVHPLAAQETLTAADLAAEPFVLFPRDKGFGLYDIVMSTCAQAGFAPPITQEAIQMPTILGLVAVGLGVSLLPASIMALGREDVVYRPLREPHPRAAIALAWHPARETAVMGHFRERCHLYVATDG